MNKDLKLKEVAEVLQVSEKTIYRWIKDEKIPYYRINHQYRFIYEDIITWMNETKGGKQPSRNLNENELNEGQIQKIKQNLDCLNLAHCISAGGIYYKIEGESVPDILMNAVNLINIPCSIPREKVLAKLLLRENMASTSIGDGIAFPHPRIPILPQPGTETAAICFPETPVECRDAVDFKPIHTFIIILSATQERHLKIMSKLAFICKQKTFAELLKKQAKRSEIYKFLADSKI
jgi:PTS system nitrogen regulatory IIA component